MFAVNNNHVISAVIVWMVDGFILALQMICNYLKEKNLVIIYIFSREQRVPLS